HLSLGLIDGRNVWRADLDAALETVETAVDALGANRVQVAPSTTLMYVPIDVERENGLDDTVQSWLAFAEQKLEELDALATAANNGVDAAAEVFETNRSALESRANSPRTSNTAVQTRVDDIDEEMGSRDNPFRDRKKAQNHKLDLPKFPTTTIGSFPQRSEIRKKRAANKRGDISDEEYEDFIAEEIERTVRAQEEIGLDLLVHGESERSDMVEYFGQQLSGFAFTDAGWVQSYGSRCVRPPIIYGDVERDEPMTVDWLTYGDDLTDKPFKGILTGPITMLQWSFVRDDQPRSTTARQIALAMRDEVADLEEAGIAAIQVDEPAFREGLPLREEDWSDYLDWAVESFRLTTSVVDDSTQIQTHMCYSDFEDIIESVAELDADALFIEASRSDMELLEVFERFEYPNDIGPGVYDIHSPRIPSTDEMYELLEAALDVLDEEQLWVVPDCGLKTRNWDEVRPSLENMVEAAEKLREQH
ncbi:MAG: 5-methyltetrahydropteroyltriglutamate--homocysteine S-methyltransferase, partial [Bradymonadaceae bacterium]